MRVDMEPKCPSEMSDDALVRTLESWNWVAGANDETENEPANVTELRTEILRRMGAEK